MKKRTKTITLCAILSALGVVFMYISSVIPTGQLGFIAFSCLFGIAAVIELGLAAGIEVFVITSLISLLILPAKTVILFYVLFFGWYPILKSMAERVKSRVLEWVIKLAFANAALSVFYFIFNSLFLSFVPVKMSAAIIFLLFNAVFVLFDIGVSKAIGYYMKNISARINK